MIEAWQVYAMVGISLWVVAYIICYMKETTSQLLDDMVPVGAD